MTVFTSSPYSRQPLRTSDLMRWVLLCCIPGLLLQTWFFGWGTLIQLGLAALTAWLTEWAILTIRNRPALRVVGDHSALLTGVLLALALPPLLPWWITVLGTFFAIAVVKQLYGGLGQNVFNPAMAAYVLLLIAFPVAMTSWLPVRLLSAQSFSFLDTLLLIFTGFSQDGFSIQQARLTIDGITAATPLDTLKTDLRAGLTMVESLQKNVYGLVAGKGWEWVNLAYLVAGLYLLKRKIIPFAIPAGFLSALLICSLLGWLIAPDSTPSPFLHLFSGATMLGAFFIATDPVSASTTPKGRWVYGALIGVLIYCIRTWGGYPDAIAFAVLLANMTVSLIDYYTPPRVYGQKRSHS